MIARVVGVAIDAHLAPEPRNPVERARRASWVAANALAARGVTPGRTRGLDALLAEIAARPTLVDASRLPIRWRVALRALGVPTREV